MGVQRRDACGANVHRHTPERDGLIGMGEITSYAGFSKEIVRRLAMEDGFPLGNVAGKWVSSRSMVDSWLIQKIAVSVVNRDDEPLP